MYYFSPSDTYAYRLVNGSTPFTGRLEISRNNGPWGTIHGQSWTSPDAIVACRLLGFSATSTLSPDASQIFGSGQGPVHLSGPPSCVGNESSLMDCNGYLNGEWDHPLLVNKHTRDVGLTCLPGEGHC